VEIARRFWGTRRGELLRSDRPPFSFSGSGYRGKVTLDAQGRAEVPVQAVATSVSASPLATSEYEDRLRRGVIRIYIAPPRRRSCRRSTPRSGAHAAALV